MLAVLPAQRDNLDGINSIQSYQLAIQQIFISIQSNWLLAGTIICSSSRISSTLVLIFLRIIYCSPCSEYNEWNLYTPVSCCINFRKALLESSDFMWLTGCISGSSCSRYFTNTLPSSILRKASTSCFLPPAGLVLACAMTYARQQSV